MDYREANPALTTGLDSATSLLSLMSLVALVLGAVGVGMAMRAHLQQQLDSIAIMKSLGAGTAQIMKIYVLQTVMLGLAGGAARRSAGRGRTACVSPYSSQNFCTSRPVFTSTRVRWWQASSAGLLTTLLFTLPPLLDIRNVRPILIFRRAVERRKRQLLSNAGPRKTSARTSSSCLPRSCC